MIPAQTYVNPPIYLTSKYLWPRSRREWPRKPDPCRSNTVDLAEPEEGARSRESAVPLAVPVFARFLPYYATILTIFGTGVNHCQGKVANSGRKGLTAGWRLNYLQLTIIW